MRRTFTPVLVAVAIAAAVGVVPAAAQADERARAHELHVFYRAEVRTDHEILRVRWSRLIPRLKAEETTVDQCLPTIVSDVKAKTISQSDAELLDFEAFIEVAFGSMRPLDGPLAHMASVDAKLRLVFSERQRATATKAARLLKAVEDLQTCTDFDAWSTADWASDATPTGVKVTKQVLANSASSNPASEQKVLKQLSPSERKTLRSLDSRAQRHLNHPTKAYSRQLDQWVNSQGLP